MKKTVLIPTAISSLRLAVPPLFLILFNSGAISWCFLLIVFSAFTDYLDGFLARKLKVATKLGAYFDTITDFIVVIGIYTIFSGMGYYSLWLLLLITASFVQFLASSACIKKLYDPIGRFIGSALYIGIFLTLLFPINAIFIFVQVAFVGFFLISLFSRIVSFAKNRAVAP
jgi:phosphatidylglycerophosphate synthase